MVTKLLTETPQIQRGRPESGIKGEVGRVGAPEEAITPYYNKCRASLFIVPDILYTNHIL